MQLSHEILNDVKSKNEFYFKILNKIKPLQMVSFKNESWLTTELVADYYEVPVSTIRQVHVRNAFNLKQGVLKISCKDFTDDFRVLCKTSPKLRCILLWNLYGVFQVGMSLEKAVIAIKLREETGIPLASIKFMNLKENTIEIVAQKKCGGITQKILKNKQRIDLTDGEIVTEIKKGKIMARHVGQLFEYLSAEKVFKGRLIGSSVTNEAIHLADCLKSSGYSIEFLKWENM